MITGITTAIDFDGVAFVLADERTPFETQRKSLELIIARQSEPPPNCAAIKLWNSERGIVRQWQFPKQSQDKPEPKQVIQSKQKMKKILSVLLFAAAVAFFAPDAQAQLATSVNAINILTNCASGVTNLATPIVIDCRKQKDIALSLTFKHNGTGTDVCGFKLQRSVDGTVALANGVDEYWLRKAAVGAAGSTITTNITVSGYPYLVLSLCSNAVAGQDITNVTIRYWVKANSP